jgi:F-type H+-transporting ATPase subunit a
MKLSPKAIIIILVALAVFVFGFIFLRGPTPHIAIAAETLFSVGPIDVTNTMITSWIVVGTMVLVVFLATRRWEDVPRGAQNVVEAVVEAFYNLVINVAGEKNGRRFFPVVATIFFFVLASNWLSLLPIFNVIGGVQEEEHGFVMEDAGGVAFVPLSGPGGLSADSIDEDDPDHEEQFHQAQEDGKVVGELLPFFRGPNTDLNTTLALAIVSAIAVETWGITSLGIRSYGSKFFRPGTFFRGLARFNPAMVFQGIIDGFVGFLEFISECVRLLSFTARLFGNMFAGEVVILMFTFMTPLLITTFIFYPLELFVGVIQAFIFAMLTLVFGVMAVAHGEHSAHEEAHEPEHKDQPIEHMQTSET